MRNWILIAIISTIFISAISGAYFLYQRRVSEAELTIPPLSQPEEGFQPSTNQPENSGNTTNPRGDVLAAQPEAQPQTGISEQMADPGILITSPQSYSDITTPLMVNGWTKIPSGDFVLKIIDQNGTILVQTTASSCSNLDVCYFESSLNFATPQTKFGTLEAYWTSGNNSEEDFTSIVVQFN